MTASVAQTEAAKDMMRFFIREVARHGGKIKYIHAHRQTSKTRRSDPGELIWKSIAVPIMREFDLTFGWDGVAQEDFAVPDKKHRIGRHCWTTRGPGKPIPREWDDNATAKY